MGRGSTGNVIAALCSFFIPGLGQLLQGRWLLGPLVAGRLYVYYLHPVVDHITRLGHPLVVNH